MSFPRLAWLVCALLLWACENTDAPKDPVWNKQPCDHCHMVLSDPRYAAQLATKDGQRLYFDDVGCLAAYVTQHKGAEAHLWVHQGSAWLDARQARYATGMQTPMGFGFAPSPSGALDFDAVVSSVAKKNAQANTP